MRLRITTWNVNSVRLRLDGIAALVEEQAPDVLCLQETKVRNELFPLDAFHAMADGSVVFSTSTDVTQGFGGLPSFKNGDLIVWDGTTASILFSEQVGFGDSFNNIDNPTSVSMMG